MKTLSNTRLIRLEWVMAADGPIQANVSYDLWHQTVNGVARGSHLDIASTIRNEMRHKIPDESY